VKDMYFSTDLKNCQASTYLGLLHYKQQLTKGILIIDQLVGSTTIALATT
jgi:hypothetical protein